MRLANYITLGDLGATTPASSSASGIDQLQRLLNPTSTAAGQPASMPPPVNGDVIAQATAEAANISKIVSPWLWIFSVTGFVTALLNTSRVNSMWKRYGGSKFKGLKKPY